MQAPPQPRHSRRDTPPARDSPAALLHLDALYNFARWLTRDDLRARAAVQQAYLETFQRPDSNPAPDARVRLMAIVRRACHAGLQRVEEPRGSESEATSPPASEDDPRRTNDALRGLPFELREVIVLREMEDLPYKAISAITGVPVGIVMSRLGLARARLARCLARDEA